MKVVAAALVLLLVLAFGSYKQQQSPVVISCGTVSGGSSMVAKGAEWAEKLGTWVHNVAENPEQYRDPENVRKVVEGVLKDVIWFWLRAAYLGLKGQAPDPEILRLKDDAAKQAQQARDLCTPCPAATGPSPLAATPADKLSASVPGYSNSVQGNISSYTPTGSPEEVTRQAAARYFPASEVDTAVAVATAESTNRDDPPGAPVVGGHKMLGRWQINSGAHANLVAGKNWRDPSVNAWMAYQIWHDAGDSWTPWSTFTSGSYRKFLSSGSEAPERPVEVTGTAPGIGCQAGSMPDLRIATWNSYYGSRHPGSSGPSGVERIRKAMATIGAQADIIGGQEFSEASHKQAANDGLGADWAIVAGDTSHPIWYRKSKFTLTSSESVKVFSRGDDYEGPSQGDRYVNTAVLRDIATGKTVTEINTHQLPKIEKSGKLNAAWPKRSALARKIWATVADSARKHMSEGAVVATMDSNMTSNDPEGLFSAAGLTSAQSLFGSAKQATRTRDIDKVFYSAGVPTTAKIIGAFGSDHSGRIVTFLASTSTTAGLSTAGSRTVKDPASGKTYTIPIPTGPRGVAINFALDQLGDPYVWASRGPDSWDCSSLVSAAWGKAGVTMTPQTEAMRRELRTTKTAQPGDILYHPGHVQLALANGLVVEAPRTGLTVRIVEKNWMTPTMIFDPTAGGTAA